MDSIAPGERDWWTAAALGTELSDAPLARRALAGFLADGASQAIDSVGLHAWFLAQVALAEHRWDDGIELMLQADARFQVDQRDAMATIGMAHDAAGRPDSAIAWFQQYLSTPDVSARNDGWYRARLDFRLGELYEARGDLGNAARQYEEFLHLWRDADPELQPRVRDARERLARLKAQAG